MKTKPQHKKFGIAGVAVCAVLVSMLVPWAFHIGQRLTPLYWSGTGMLATSGRKYPLYVLIYPSMKRANGLQGWASLCTSRNTVMPLEVDGGFRDGWWSLDHASMEIGLLETQGARDTLFDPNNRGAIDLVGAWRGAELVLANRNESPERFRSGLKLEHASVTLTWGSKSDFSVECSNMGNAGGVR